MRSEVTLRSNWAKDSRTLSVSLPIEVVVLNCCVTETKDTPWASNSSTSLAKSAKERVRRSGLNEGSLEAARETLGAGSLAVRADVSNLTDLDTMFATIKREFRHLD